MYISRVVRGIRKTGSNLHRDDAEKTRLAKLRSDIKMRAFTDDSGIEFGSRIGIHNMIRSKNMRPSKFITEKIVLLVFVGAIRRRPTTSYFVFGCIKSEYCLRETWPEFVGRCPDSRRPQILMERNTKLRR